jgi:hypothetical protein
MENPTTSGTSEKIETAAARRKNSQLHCFLLCTHLSAGRSAGTGGVAKGVEAQTQIAPRERDGTNANVFLHAATNNNLRDRGHREKQAAAFLINLLQVKCSRSAFVFVCSSI